MVSTCFAWFYRSISAKKLCSSCAQPLGKGAAMIIESLGLYFHLPCFKVLTYPLLHGTSQKFIQVVLFCFADSFAHRDSTWNAFPRCCSDSIYLVFNTDVTLYVCVVQCGVCKGLLGDTTSGTDVRIRGGVLNCHECYLKSRGE